MLVRNVGFVSVISTLLLSLMEVDTQGEFLIRLGVLGGGVILLFLLSQIRLLDRFFTKIIEWGIRHWGKVRAVDYESLLNLTRDYEVVEKQVDKGDWVAAHSLKELKLSEEGVLVLGVQMPDGSFIGAPRGSTFLPVGGRIIAYGQEQALQRIMDREVGPEGDIEHKEAVRRLKKTGETPEKEEEAPKGSVLGFLKKMMGKKKL